MHYDAEIMFFSAAGSRVEVMRREADAAESKKVEEELYEKEDKLYEGLLKIIDGNNEHLVLFI